MSKRYIGDGVFVDYDGYAIVLTSENGIEVLDRVVIDYDMWRLLEVYVAGLTAQRGSPAADTPETVADKAEAGRRVHGMLMDMLDEKDKR